MCATFTHIHRIRKGPWGNAVRFCWQKRARDLIRPHLLAPQLKGPRADRGGGLPLSAGAMQVFYPREDMTTARGWQPPFPPSRGDQISGFPQGSSREPTPSRERRQNGPTERNQAERARRRQPCRAFFAAFLVASSLTRWASARTAACV